MPKMQAPEWINPSVAYRDLFEQFRSAQVGVAVRRSVISARLAPRPGPGDL